MTAAAGVGRTTQRAIQCHRRVNTHGPPGSGALFEPGVGLEIVKNGQPCSVVENQVVIQAADRKIAPPLVVDTPLVLDGGDRARCQATVPPQRDDLAGGVGLDAQRTGRIQRPHIAAPGHRRAAD